MATQILEIIIRVVDRAATRNIKKVDTATKGLNKTLKQTTSFANASRNALLGVGLTSLFAGMALARGTKRALDAMFNVSKLAGAEVLMFNVKTQELAATWEFFKFTFIEALSQSALFVRFIDFLVGVINWLGKLSDGVKVFIFFALLIGFVVGTLVSLAGQIALVGVGIVAMKELGLIAWLAKVGRGVLLLSQKVAALTIKMLLNPVTLWIVGFTLLIGLIIFGTIKFGGLGNALKAFGATALTVFSLIADTIIRGLLFPFKLFVAALLVAHDLMVKIGAIEPVSVGVIDAARRFLEFEPTFASRAAELIPEPVMSNAEVIQTIKDTLGELVSEIGKSAKEGIKEGVDETGGLTSTTVQ